MKLVYAIHIFSLLQKIKHIHLPEKTYTSSNAEVASVSCMCCHDDLACSLLPPASPVMESCGSSPACWSAVRPHLGRGTPHAPRSPGEEDGTTGCHDGSSLSLAHWKCQEILGSSLLLQSFLAELGIARSTRF